MAARPQSLVDTEQGYFITKDARQLGMAARPWSIASTIQEYLTTNPPWKKSQKNPASFLNIVTDLEDPALECRWLGASV